MTCYLKYFAGLLFIVLLFSCKNQENTQADKKDDTVTESDKAVSKLLEKYTPFQLTSDMSVLSENQKKMIPVLIEAARIMDDLFWYEAYGSKKEFLASLTSDNETKFGMINYGPWDRLGSNEPWLEGAGKKPEGANYYPQDMTKEEFDAAELKGKDDLYTFIRRDDEGKLVAIPYHVQFKEQHERAASLLEKAASYADNAQLKNYLTLRADALRTDNYQPSDMAWLDMKTNQIDFVVGPIETYEDQLYGYKAAHEAYVLIKDMEWSKKLEKYAAFLPDLQKGLPVPAKYKAETPGSDTELNAYDVVYYAGDCNSGSKTIAINLPNDEEVQLAKGTRRLQLKNAMKAKFDKILEPIADELIDPTQRKHITFDAFFSNTMFHEVAHGLGIKNTINNKGPVRRALREFASALEEGKADMLGLYMIKQLHDKGEIEGELNDYYVTFMAGIFRSVRFGASSAHGKANMIRFNFFDEMGAFSRDEKTGKYTVNFDKFEKAMNALSEKILTLQGDGDYVGVGRLVEAKGKIGPGLQADLDMLAEKGIPVDIIFEQGADVLGL